MSSREVELQAVVNRASVLGSFVNRCGRCFALYSVGVALRVRVPAVFVRLGCVRWSPQSYSKSGHFGWLARRATPCHVALPHTQQRGGLFGSSGGPRFQTFQASLERSLPDDSQGAHAWSSLSAPPRHRLRPPPVPTMLVASVSLGSPRNHAPASLAQSACFTFVARSFRWPSPVRTTRRLPVNRTARRGAGPSRTYATRGT